jgi:hypothetical protein
MKKKLLLLCTGCALALVFVDQSATAQTSSDLLPQSPGNVLVSSNDADSSSSTPLAQTASSGATPSTAEQEHHDGQTKRILGIIPNFRSVNVNAKLPPQPVKEKFVTATEDSFDYSSFILPAIVAGESQLTDATPEFHQGVVGFGRYYWHALVDQTIENYSVEFIVPSITHEDTRYYTMGTGGFWKRTGYAMSRIVITRSDSGKETFNAGEVVGAGMAAGISNTYYPQSQRTVGNTLSKWGLNVGIDAASFFAKEFWPDINHILFHQGDYNSK